MAVRTKTKADSKRYMVPGYAEVAGSMTASERSIGEMLQPTIAMVAEWETLQKIGCDDELLRKTIAIVQQYHESKNGCGGVCYFTAPDHTVYWLRNGCDFWLYPRAESIAKTINVADLPADPHLPEDAVFSMVRDLFDLPFAEVAATTKDANHAKGNGSKPKKTKTSAAKSSGAGSLMEVTIGSIVVSDGANPRKSFDEEALKKLADSIKQDGLIQPLAVRKNADGNLELLAGERRLRAAKIAKLSTVPVLIRNVDDATAARIRLAENYVRENLNPIDEAAAFQTLLDEHGFSQRELAEYFGLSQGKIGNAVRLLNLPEAWQKRVISQEITTTMGRQLATWADVPAVLKRMQEGTKSRGTLDAHRFDGCLREAIKEASRPVSGEFYSEKGWTKVRLSPKDKKREDLDIREVEIWNGKQKRAFNVPLWEELQKAGEERSAKAQQAKGNSSADRGTRKADAPKLTPAEQKRRTEQKRKQFEGKLRSYYLGWLQKLILAHLDEQVGKIDPHVWIRIVLYFACETSKTWQRQQELEAIIKKHGGKVTRSGPGHQGRLFESLSSIAIAEDFRLVIVEACRAWVSHSFEPPYQADLQPEVLTTLAGEFGIELDSHWACEREFLELHSKDQLQALAKEWKIKLADGKRTAMIDALDTALRIPPKALLKVAK